MGKDHLTSKEKSCCAKRGVDVSEYAWIVDPRLSKYLESSILGRNGEPGFEFMISMDCRARRRGGKVREVGESAKPPALLQWSDALFKVLSWD